MHGTLGARRLLAGLAPLLPRDPRNSGQMGQARGQEVARWCKDEGWDLEVVERAPGMRGFSVQPRRPVVERPCAWLSRKRRWSKDDERKVQTSETVIPVAMIRLLLARLGRKSSSVLQPALREPGTVLVLVSQPLTLEQDGSSFFCSTCVSF